MAYRCWAISVTNLGRSNQCAVSACYSRSIPFKHQHPKVQNFIRKEFRVMHRVQKGNQTLIVKSANFTVPKLIEAINTTSSSRNPDEIDMNKVYYQVTVTTASSYDSSLSDMNAGILFMLIGEEGKCFLYRLCPIALGDDEMTLNWQSHNLHIPAATHQRFQRGSSDVFMISGPNLGKLQTVWIGPERGSWRMDKLSITVVPTKMVRDDLKDIDIGIVQYDFEYFNKLIGDGGVVSAAEVKALQASHLSYPEYLEFLSRTKVSKYNVAEARAKGMKEYEMLKLSLLSYDAFFVMLGTAVSAGTGHSEIAYGFFAGGISGFLYLCVLQQAVDRIPPLNNIDNLHDPSCEIDGSSEMLKSEEQSQFSGFFSGFRAPFTRIAAAVVIMSIIGKVLFSNNELIMSKEILFAGAAGFLMSKISTVLASTKPLYGD